MAEELGLVHCHDEAEALHKQCQDQETCDQRSQRLPLNFQRLEQKVCQLVFFAGPHDCVMRSRMSALRLGPKAVGAVVENDVIS